MWTWITKLNAFRVVMGRNGAEPARPSTPRMRRRNGTEDIRKAVWALEQEGAVLLSHTMLKGHYKNAHVAQICVLRYARKAGFRVVTSTTKRGALLVRRTG